MISKIQKERAQKVIPGGTKTKESSSKSLNDVKKSITCFTMTRRFDQNVVLVDQDDLLDDQKDVLVGQTDVLIDQNVVLID